MTDNKNLIELKVLRIDNCIILKVNDLNIYNVDRREFRDDNLKIKIKFEIFFEPHNPYIDHTFDSDLLSLIIYYNSELENETRGDLSHCIQMKDSSDAILMIQKIHTMIHCINYSFKLSEKRKKKIKLTNINYLFTTIS